MSTYHDVKQNGKSHSQSNFSPLVVATPILSHQGHPLRLRCLPFAWTLGPNLSPFASIAPGQLITPRIAFSDCVRRGQKGSGHENSRTWSED